MWEMEKCDGGWAKSIGFLGISLPPQVPASQFQLIADPEAPS